jgi:hypothetical protein
MNKIYHYLYTIDDLKQDHPGLQNLNSDDPPGPEIDDCRDVFAYLDRYNFDVNSSVVQKLVEFAGRQLRGH